MIRALISHLKVLPTWQFAAIAVATLGFLRAAFGVAGLHQNEGAVELFSILRFAAFLGLLFVLVQRRQSDAWSAAIQGAVIVLAAQLLALLLMLPFLPSILPSGKSLAFTMLVGLGIQSIVAGLAVPLAAGLIWLSRYRYRSSLPPSDEPPSASVPPAA